MPAISQDRVYTGFWVDYSRGNVLGATITINSDVGNIVIAIISIFITIAGAHLWNIIACLCFGFHTTNGPADGLHPQRQLLLRNVASPADVLWKTLQMFWRWRKQQYVRPFRRLCHIAMAAVLCVAGFVIAGIISSQIVSTAAIRILAQSSSCGFPITSGQLSLTDAYNEHWYKSRTAAAQYGRACYNTTNNDPTCQVFAVQSLPFNTTYRSCPYEGACWMNDTSRAAITMDTGLLASDVMFGINAKPKDRISLRKVTTCAPLRMAKFGTLEFINPNDTEMVRLIGRPPVLNEQLARYYLGPLNPNNFTIGIPSAQLKLVPGYSFFAAGWRMPSPSTDQTRVPLLDGYNPLPIFKDFGGDFTLFSIGGYPVSYEQPCHDPVFSATKRVVKNDTWYNPANNSFLVRADYATDSVQGGIGCSEQYQFCLPNGNCSALAGLGPSTMDVFQNFRITPMQNVTIFAFMSAILQMQSEMNMIRDIKPSLLAENALRNTLMYLPPNQWELEVKSWKAIVLSNLMRALAEHAAGFGAFFPNSNNFDKLPLHSPGPYDHILCHAQKLAAPDGFSNISVLGLLLVLILCGLIVIISMSLVPILRFISGFRRKPWLFLHQWDDNELLNYQRLAFEAGGVQGWTGKPSKVPVLPAAQVLPSLASLAPQQMTARPTQPMATTAAPTILTATVTTTPTLTPTPPTNPPTPPPRPSPTTSITNSQLRPTNSSSSIAGSANNSTTNLVNPTNSTNSTINPGLGTAAGTHTSGSHLNPPRRIPRRPVPGTGP